MSTNKPFHYYQLAFALPKDERTTHNLVHSVALVIRNKVLATLPAPHRGVMCEDENFYHPCYVGHDEEIIRVMGYANGFDIKITLCLKEHEMNVDEMLNFIEKVNSTYAKRTGIHLPTYTVTLTQLDTDKLVSKEELDFTQAKVLYENFAIVSPMVKPKEKAKKTRGGYTVDPFTGVAVKQVESAEEEEDDVCE